MHEQDREVVIDILDNRLWALDQIQKQYLQSVRNMYRNCNKSLN